MINQYSHTATKTMSKQNKQKTYVFDYNTETNIVTKTDPDTGNSWLYPSRPKQSSPVCKAKNGVTIKDIQDAGFSVRVKHLRYAWYMPHLLAKKHVRYIPVNEIRLMVVPSTFRKDINYTFVPHGGFTHIVIKTQDGEYICVSSECAPDDPFCYAAGVASALDRLTRADRLVLGL